MAVVCGQKLVPSWLWNRGPSADLWPHLPTGGTKVCWLWEGRRGRPQSEGQGRCRGPCWIPRVPCPHHPDGLLWLCVPLSQRLHRPDAARKRAHLLRWGPASSPPFVSFTLTPVAHRYKSNEEYVYVRGRGRGKYVCEECGIRCKKPSMLKKHIRTHTDVRPYVCKHCHFAFKTKGKRQSAGPLALPLQAAPLWEPQHRAQGPRPLCLGLGHPHFLGSPMAEQLAPDRPPACLLGSHTPRTWHSPPPGGPLAPSWFRFALITHPFLCMSPKPFVHPPDKLQHPHLSLLHLHLEIHSTPSH